MKKNFFNRKKNSDKKGTEFVVLDLSNEKELKENKTKGYLDAFLQPRVLKQRQCVYISQDVHEFIAKIVNKLNVKDLTIGVFIDTVMAQHIKDHMDELRDIYYKNEGDIFGKITNNE